MPPPPQTRMHSYSTSSSALLACILTIQPSHSPHALTVELYSISKPDGQDPAIRGRLRLIRVWIRIISLQLPDLIKVLVLASQTVYNSQG